VRGGKGEGARAVRAERAAPLGRVRATGGGGELGRQRPKARDERGVKLGQGFGVGPKSVKGIKTKEKLLYFPEL